MPGRPGPQSTTGRAICSARSAGPVDDRSTRPADGVDGTTPGIAPGRPPRLGLVPDGRKPASVALPDRGARPGSRSAPTPGSWGGIAARARTTVPPKRRRRAAGPDRGRIRACGPNFVGEARCARGSAGSTRATAATVVAPMVGRPPAPRTLRASVRPPPIDGSRGPRDDGRPWVSRPIRSPQPA